MSSPLLLPLKLAKKTDAERIGPKAFGLVRLRAWGLGGLDALSLTTAAFELHLEAGGLRAGREALWKSFLDERDPSVLEGLCEAFQRAIQQAPLRGEILAALYEGLLPMGPGPYAVRSSHGGEDGLETAGAGIFETRLGVEAVEMATAIRSVWASAYGYAALSHGLRCGRSPQTLAPAVLIQPMVAAVSSGVLFTRSPDGLDHSVMVLAAHQGLGDRLVSGELSGVTVLLPRADALPRTLEDLPLPPAEIAKLRAWGLKIETNLKAPADIEWAFDGKQTFILQLRPITSLLNLPGLKKNHKAIHWDRALSEERFPEPISPLGWSCLQNVFLANLKVLESRFGLKARHPEEVGVTFGHWVYSNADFFKVPGSMRLRFAPFIRLAPRFMRASFRLFDLTRWPSALQTLGQPRKGPLGVSPADLQVRFLTEVASAFIFGHAGEVEAAWHDELPGHLERIAALNRGELGGLSDKDLREHLDRVITTGNAFMAPDLAIYLLKMAALKLLEAWLVLLGEQDPAGAIAALTAGLSDNVTLEMSQALARLAGGIEDSPALLDALRGERNWPEALRDAPGIQASWDTFLIDYGHMTTNWDIRRPTWGEDPNQVLLLLRGMLRAPKSKRIHLETQRSARVAQRESASAALLAKAAPWPWACAFLSELLAVLHRFMAIDETLHVQCSRLYPPSRRVITEIARRMVARGQLSDLDQIYFLKQPEIEGAFGMSEPYPLHYLAELRKASFERAANHQPPAGYRDLTPMVNEAAQEPLDSAVLKGTPASPGRARGRVRIIAHPEDLAHFMPGEILVTSSPNPAWTPLYAVAGGLVTSTGSALSHGFISAREYALPAVSGIANAPMRFASGEWVELDGLAGWVRRLSALEVAHDDRHAAV